MGTALSTRKTPPHILKALRETYHSDPERYVERTREHRRRHGKAINARRRELAAEKRGVELKRKAAHARIKLAREPRTLAEWFPTQARFSEWAQLAREVGVSRRTVLDWRTDKHPAVRGHRRKLYEITGLSYFADAANWKAREKPARKIGEAAAVPLLAELVVRCGLPTRELRQLRLSQIEDKGIRLANGRLILFGEGWEQVSRGSLDAWLHRARPTELLFFSRKPVNRERPASGVWISRVLRASGVSIQERRSTRLRHFAGDFTLLGSGRRFTDHLRKTHRLSKSGSRENAEALRDRLALLRTGGGSLDKNALDAAFDKLFPPKKKPGRRRGMTTERIKEAIHLSEFVKLAGGKRGALKAASKKVYQNVSPDLAYDRARQTLKDWKHAGSPKA